MSASEKKRLMLYMHFDRDDFVDPHIFYQLTAFHDFGVKIIFISNSKILKEDENRLRSLSLEVILRENVGLDFGGWKDVLLAKGHHYFSALDELILCNSTCYGPLFPLSELFNCMNTKICDFWGITNYFAKEWPEHVQSNFLVFRHNILVSPSFWLFWENLRSPSDYTEAIHCCEIYLTTYFHSVGFQYSTYVEIKDRREFPFIGLEEPFCMNCPDWLVYKYRLPFVKIKGFRFSPQQYFCHGGEIFEALRLSGSSYPTTLMLRHLERIAPLSWKKNLPGTLSVLRSYGTVRPDPKLKIAVFAHIFYLDTLQESLSFLSNIPYVFDFFITVCDSDTEVELKLAVENSKLNLGKLVIRKVVNHGRDALSWLAAFRDEHLNYDLALKFQVKKSLQAPEMFGYKQHLFFMNCLLYNSVYISELINLFHQDMKLGLVFPTYPPVYHLATCVGYNGTPACQAHWKEWLTRLRMRIPEENDNLIFPMGTFWYRPKALKNLLLCDIRMAEFPKEPFPLTGTIAHGLERAIPYIAQGNGYGYKLAIQENVLVDIFQIYEDRLNSARARHEYVFIPTVNIRKAVFIFGKAVLNSYWYHFPKIARFLLRIENPVKKVLKKFLN